MNEEVLKIYRISICRKNNSDNFAKEHTEYIYSQLVDNHLLSRGFRTYNLSEGIIISDNNIKFSISKVEDLEHPYFHVYIKCMDKWRNYQTGVDPIIINLIFDFFKLHSDTWDIIEFLNPNELILVESFKRRYTPFIINKRLKGVTVSKESRKFNLHRIPVGGSETIIAWANKNDYLDSIEFWFNYTSWDFIDGEVFYGDPSNRNACIPQDVKALLWQINQIYSVLNKEITGELLEVYLMDRQWDDNKHLFIFQNIYVTHNWWTGN